MNNGIMIRARSWQWLAMAADWNSSPCASGVLLVYHQCLTQQTFEHPEKYRNAGTSFAHFSATAVNT
jgi:hypothetical protein